IDPMAINPVLYEKSKISARAGMTEFAHVKNAFKKLDWAPDLANVNHYIGTTDSRTILTKEIENAEKIVSLGGIELNHDVIRDAVQTMGAGDNPADGALVIKNHDGSLAIKFISNKQSLNDFQSASTAA